MNHPSATNPNICPDCEQLMADAAPTTAAQVLGADAEPKVEEFDDATTPAAKKPEVASIDPSTKPGGGRPC